MGDIDGVKAYIDDLLAIKKGTFFQHLELLEEVFRRCQKSNLKLNAEKCSFGLDEIEYLGYKVTPQGVKPNPKKKSSHPSHGTPFYSNRSEKFYWHDTILQRFMAKKISYVTTIY